MVPSLILRRREVYTVVPLSHLGLKTRLHKMAADNDERMEAKLEAGIIYISKIPPFMKPGKVKSHMEQFGEVGRVFLQPEGS